MGRVAQTGVRGAQEGLTRFVEGPDGRRQPPAAAAAGPMDESRKAFWDDFASVADQRHGTGPKYSAVGTSAMGRAGNKNTADATGAAAKKKDDEWDDW